MWTLQILQSSPDGLRPSANRHGAELFRKGSPHPSQAPRGHHDYSGDTLIHNHQFLNS